MKNGILKVDTLDVSIAKRFRRGEITLLEAAREFYRHGWTNFVDESAALRFINNHHL